MTRCWPWLPLLSAPRFSSQGRERWTVACCSCGRFWCSHWVRQGGPPGCHFLPSSFRTGANSLLLRGEPWQQCCCPSALPASLPGEAITAKVTPRPKNSALTVPCTHWKLPRAPHNQLDRV